MPLVSKDRKAIIGWLLACAAMVALMVAVGGYTRLSGSGMSITQWKPIHGVIPPLDEVQWEEEFAGYRTTPQYQQVNKGMTLPEFKVIFWPEFFHRVLGRLVGVVFFLPLLVFAVRRSLSRAFGLRLAGIFALGGLQGFIGWFMVASGLSELTYVSHLRLALHLAVAFAIFALLLWAALDVARGQVKGHIPRGYKLWFFALCMQITLGAFVAGLHGGLIYNTFPDMNGQLIPAEAFAELPFYRNFLFSIPLIQFMHRWLAVIVAFGFIFWWRAARDYVRDTGLKGRSLWVAVAIALQFTLGVLTLLNQAPLDLALAHQLTALALFALAVNLLHGLKEKNDV